MLVILVIEICLQIQQNVLTPSRASGASERKTGSQEPKIMVSGTATARRDNPPESGVADDLLVFACCTNVIPHI